METGTAGMAKGFELNGKHVLAIMVGFFAVIIAVNAVFLTVAIRSFPGEHEEKSYLQGLNYNDRLAAREAQAALGWSAAIEEARLEGETGRIVLSFAHRDGEPIFDLDIKGLVSRPVNDDNDIDVVFAPDGPGRYVAEVGGLAPGAWMLRAKAEDKRMQTFVIETKVMLK